jgi:hypothetical protein
MRRLNRSRAEIEHYYNLPIYRNEQDFVRGRLNHVRGRELWQERTLRLREEADIQRAYDEQNVARLDAHYLSRGRGRGRGRGRVHFLAPRVPLQEYTVERNNNRRRNDNGGRGEGAAEV